MRNAAYAVHFMLENSLFYHFRMKVVLIRTQPEKACPTKNVVFMRVSGFVVLTQSYHPQRGLRTNLSKDHLSTGTHKN